MFLVSFGAPRAETEDSCKSGSDGLPDDLRPGDRLSARGTLDAYAPAACAEASGSRHPVGVARALQLRVDASCPITRAPPGALPEPARIDAALASQLADGSNAELLREWGGALVRLESMSAELDPEDGDAVFPFGVIRLQETPFEVHSRLYYFDLSGAGPRDPKKGPGYAYPTHFDSLTGIVLLDYCSWVLAPRDRCSDLLPKSAGCD